MDATDRIVEEFNRLVALERSEVAQRSAAERIVYYIVTARCEIDVNSFEDVYAQALDLAELAMLIDGLHRIGEIELASEFQSGVDLLKRDGFYERMNWNEVSESVRAAIESIGERVGDRLWALDEKLAALLDAEDGPVA